MPPAGKTLYITFDDGPNPETTPAILDILEDYDAKATFFCVGENVTRYPEHYQSIIEAGHGVGNHAYNHLKGWETNTDEYVENVKKCSEVVNSPLFRPPYGKMKRAQQRILRRQFNIIMWTVLSRDYDPKVDAETCLKKSLKYTCPGAIVIFHDHLKTIHKIKYVLPKYLAEVKAKGYTLKVLSFED